ncbi:hypothetical protein AA0113_g5333 [Alternaria arborescens]|uniref:C3H1-type domain-containing protein n=1 Tax=Alternaria arborescens TaxID=156630 RepID=A0A4Q4S5T2_9PLEO|nr:hypothetical protein AA0113_g5333 [Alternaria arborescens]
MDSSMSGMGGMGGPKFTQSEAVGQQVCHQWPLGQCKFGSGEGGCAREHPPNLSPHQTKELPDFVISNEPGKACHRCLNLGIEASLLLLSVAVLFKS